MQSRSLTTSPGLASLPMSADGGRRHTLAQTGQALFMMGYCDRPMPPNRVQEIERRALSRLREELLKS